MASVSTDSQTRRRGPGRPKGGALVADRTQLLAAAERVIRADGPDVTMDDIAAAAHVTKPIVYRAIGDKDALVAALSEALVDRIAAAIDDAAEARSAATDPRAEFYSSVRGYLSTVSADRNLFLFVNASGQRPDQLRQLVDRSAHQLIEAFSALHASVGSEPKIARTWAYAIVGSFQIVTMMWLRDEYAELDDVAEHLTALLWPGVAGA